MHTIIVGLDIAKAVFQVHAEDGAGKVVQQKRLRRSQVLDFFGKLPAALIGLEACGSAHYWARELRALGHEVRLIPAAYVKPFVRRNKTDARDAAAICVAVSRPDMRFVTIKSADQQARRGLERSRELLVKQRTQLMNSLRSQMSEHGVIAAQGRRGYAALVERVRQPEAELPEDLVIALGVLADQVEALTARIDELDARIANGHQPPVRMTRCGG